MTTYETSEGRQMPVSPVPPYVPPGTQDRVPPSRAGDASDGPVLEGVVLGGPDGASGRGRPFGASGPFGGGVFGPFGAGPGAGRAGGPVGTAGSVPQKSLVLAAVLAAVIPPLGVLYGSILGGLAMIVLFLPVVLVAGKSGLAFLWLAGIVWAVYGAHCANRRRVEFARALGLIP